MLFKLTLNIRNYAVQCLMVYLPYWKEAHAILNINFLNWQNDNLVKNDSLAYSTNISLYPASSKVTYTLINLHSSTKNTPSPPVAHRAATEPCVTHLSKVPTSQFEPILCHLLP